MCIKAPVKSKKTNKSITFYLPKALYTLFLLKVNAIFQQSSYVHSFSILTINHKPPKHSLLTKTIKKLSKKQIKSNTLILAAASALRTFIIFIQSPLG